MIEPARGAVIPPSVGLGAARLSSARGLSLGTFYS